jgi:streptomycin 6-kinase
LSKQLNKTYYIHGDFHPGNVVAADRAAYLAIDPKGIVGHIGYDIAVFLNNLEWWQRKHPDVREFLQTAIEQFSTAFSINKREIREWAFAYMVIGAWWSFDEMPEHYDNEVVLSDVWGV